MNDAGFTNYKKHDSIYFDNVPHYNSAGVYTIEYCDGPTIEKITISIVKNHCNNNSNQLCSGHDVIIIAILVQTFNAYRSLFLKLYIMMMSI